MPHPFSPRLLILVVFLLFGRLGISRAENYALIVGVNLCPAYQQNGIKPRPLRGAERDACKIADLLENRFGFSPNHVKVLKGKDATREAIHCEFKKLALLVKKGDQVVFHFSGHGTQCLDTSGDERQGDGLDEALCPYDTKANGENLILDDDLAQWLAGINGHSITVILDCCHSGTGIKAPKRDFQERFLPMVKARPRPNPIQKDSSWSDLDPSRKDAGRRIKAIYACQSDQRAYEGRHPTFNCQMGLFTGYLLEGLSKDSPADVDGKGRVSVKEIVDYAKRKIDDYYNEGLRPKDRQTPTMQASVETWSFILEESKKQ